MTKMDKEYIEKEYEQAIKEYNAALTEDDLDTSRRTMKRLEAIAMQDYGFDYADELATKKEACKKYDWQDTHFVIHLETDSIYITKNLVCKFPFLELY